MTKKQGYGEKAVRIMELLNTTNKPDHQIASAVGCHVTYVKALRRKMAHKVEEVVKEEVKTPLNPVEKVLNSRSNADEDPLGKLLDQRASQYGSFMASANVAIRLKGVMHNAIAQQDLHLAPDQLLALDMIAVKISRILTGNPSHKDSWVDIAGYAKLVADRLQGNVR
jgi:hypothetical protein